MEEAETDFEDIQESIDFIRLMHMRCNDGALHQLLLTAHGKSHGEKLWNDYKDRVLIPLGEMQQYAGDTLAATTLEPRRQAVQIAGYHDKLRKEKLLYPEGKFASLINLDKINEIADAIEDVKKELWTAHNGDAPRHMTTGKQVEDYREELRNQVIELGVWTDDLRSAAIYLDAESYPDYGMGQLQSMHQEMFAAANPGIRRTD